MRSAFRGPAHKLAVRMRINNCTHGHNNNYGPSKPAMHHAPATARAPRVCTLVPFIIQLILIIMIIFIIVIIITSGMLSIMGRA